MFARRNHGFLRLFLAAVWLAASVLSVRAQNPKPMIGSSVTPTQEAAESQRIWLPIFQFRNVFWVNLQHFLYLQARIERGLPVITGAQPSPSLAAADLSHLTPAEQQAWRNAVGYYAAHFANYELSYDSFLVRVDDRLSEMGACPDITGQSDSSCDAGIDPSLTKVLEEAAPVYRAHWWSEQQKKNEAWIALASNLIREYGGKPAELLAAVFDNNWPGEPIPIDVTLYAGSYGAYTTLDPLHISVSSIDHRNQSPEALEVVFRESSHTLAEPIAEIIKEECRKQTKPTPRDLWHALAFYTTARVFEQVFAGKTFAGAAPGSAPASFPTAQREYVAERRWQHYEVLLDVYWQPYLKNKIDMDSAIENLVGAL
jgi:hypothetical protein